MEYIDHIFYINRDKRTDRRIQIEDEMEKMEFPKDKIERFSAIEGGQLGCCWSHHRVLEIAKERGYTNILVLEDDFHFTIDSFVLEQELSTFFRKKLDYRVLQLSYLCLEKKPRLIEREIEDDQIWVALNCSDASAYIANVSIFDSLIQCLKDGIENLARTGQHWNYMNDQVWKQFQRDGEDKWFLLKCRAGHQNESLPSDLANQPT